MIRMLLVGYCFGIRSERRPCEEVHLNLHGRFRDCDLLRELFETTVRGAAWLKGLSVATASRPTPA